MEREGGRAAARGKEGRGRRTRRKEKWPGERFLWQLQEAHQQGLAAGDDDEDGGTRSGKMTLQEGQAFFAAGKERDGRGLSFMSIGQMRDALKAGEELVPDLQALKRQEWWWEG